VVAAGSTTTLPPAGGRVYELPSVPVTVTAVAFVALTVNVDEPPAEIEVGLALMLSVGPVAAPCTVTLIVSVDAPSQ
jgi:hypothetical protein